MKTGTSLRFRSHVDLPLKKGSSELKSGLLILYNALPTSKTARETYYTGYYKNKRNDGIVTSCVF